MLYLSCFSAQPHIPPSVAVDGYSREPAEAVDAEHDSPLEESEWGSLGRDRPLALQLCSTV